MKKLSLLLALSLPLALHAQFVVGSSGLTMKAGATVSVDGLVMQPTSDVTLASNSITRSSSNVPVATGNSINRVYEFTTPITFTGTAGIMYSDAELAGNTESALKLVTTATTGSSVWIMTSGNVINTTTNFISNTFSATPMARFTATSSSQPLPVGLLDFTARKSADEKSALLQWDVVNEMNMAQYGVQRSSDGQNFQEIGKVKAEARNTYTYTDNKPLKGINYYRLDMQEVAGTQKYSQVRQVIFTDRGTNVNVMPNPVLSTVTINTNDESLVGMQGQVIDMAGKVVTRFTLNGLATTVQATAWASGMYTIVLADGKTFKIEKR